MIALVLALLSPIAGSPTASFLASPVGVLHAVESNAPRGVSAPASSTAPTRDTPAAEAPTPADRAFAAEQARFAIELQRELGATPGNVVCSPTSLARALAMARSGAGGTTASELDRVLHLSADAGARFAALVRLFEAPEIGPKKERRPAYALELATALFGQDGAPFEPESLRRLRAEFDSELRAVDFARTEDARTTINAWAAEKTHERVKELVPRDVLSVDTRLVLVDTVHFLGAWSDPFREANTKPTPFTRADASSVDVPTMHGTELRLYAETERAQVVELPYQGGTMAMVLVLPKPGRTIDEVVREEEFATWTKDLSTRRVEVALPKFTFRFGAELKPVLTKLGMPMPFDLGAADFRGILRERLAIGAVVQQAFVAVDELGTEAAAATAVVMVRGAKSTAQEEPIVFRADHPFAFFIRHRPTGAVLFCGRVSDPSARS
ncbi:MAG: serpin family protein [Planctomycetes bacterium]|nr:serpin family protein [Planctomycetota bacterium]